MKLAYQPWGHTISEFVSAAQDAEAAGFGSLWTTELDRSAFVHTAAVAAGTERTTVGTGIALAFVRSPLTLGLAALDLADLSGGRFVLGLGSGVRRLNEAWHQARFDRPVERMAEVMQTVRLVVGRAASGERMRVSGDHVSLDVRGFRRSVAPEAIEVPIYLASIGPRMSRLAGELGDGWIGHQLNSPTYIRSRIAPELLAGLERSGRTPRDLVRVVSVCCVPHGDRNQARRWAAGVVAFYASVRTYTPFFDFHGFGNEARAIQGHFRQGEHEKMLDVCHDEMVDTFTLAGRPDDIRERLADYAEIADVLKLAPPTHLVAPEVTRAVQSAILGDLAPA